jgi:hypothetical protein
MNREVFGWAQRSGPKADKKCPPSVETGGREFSDADLAETGRAIRLS